MADKFKICPICSQKYAEHPAISRRDNKIEICPNCGMAEALEDYEKSKLSAQQKGGKNEI